MYALDRWNILLVVSLAACAVKNEENDTLFATLTATDTDASATDIPPDESSTTEDQDDTAPPQTTTGAESESGSSGPCGGGICAQPPPEGWYGPIIRWDNDGSMPPLCAEEWPDNAFTLLGGYGDPGPAQCTCNCGLNVAGLCSAAAYISSDGASTCDYANYQMLTMEDECESMTVNGSIYLSAYTQGTASCQASVERIAPEPTWELEVRGCRGAELGDACDEQGRQCLPAAPAGFEDWLCIFAEGDLECPAGDYSEKTLLYSGVEDTRNCGPCACDAPPATSCTGGWELYDNDDCTGNVVTTAALSGCAVASGVGSVRLVFGTATECGVFEDTSATGAIAPKGAMTYCCLPR